MVCHFIIQLCLHSLMFTHTYEDITETLKSYECLNILWRFVRNITFENSRNYPCLARSCTWYELSQFSWWFQFWNFIASPNEFSTNKNSRHLNEKRKKKYIVSILYVKNTCKAFTYASCSRLLCHVILNCIHFWIVFNLKNFYVIPKIKLGQNILHYV